MTGRLDMWTRRRRPRSSGRAAVVALALLIALAPPATAQEAPDGPPPDVRRAHDLLFALYPELIGRDLQVLAEPVGAQWLLTVQDGPGAGARADGLLTATVAFDARGQLVAYQARGALVEEARNAALWDQMRQHPEWGESDAELWLNRTDYLQG